MQRYYLLGASALCARHLRCQRRYKFSAQEQADGFVPFDVNDEFTQPVPPPLNRGTSLWTRPFSSGHPRGKSSAIHSRGFTR